jgi:hypothetical protein
MTEAPHRCTDAEIHRLLAEDEHIAELGIEIICREDSVVLRGDVVSPARRETIAAAVAAHFPGLAIHNDIVVSPVKPPAEAEQLP